jgi:hypothetical protein
MNNTGTLDGMAAMPPPMMLTVALGSAWANCANMTITFQSDNGSSPVLVVGR